ncbi:oxidoreductase NADbinding domain containing protein [Acanthamoeba castellanii str. Neff]|uniref:Oxidoreductase NADbinding domain containing protein n=1 Tax=Acanthamoeba castellanii (strain ATCC 30010 / Neff) TaxID=1257118 RepID=L8HI84_ACACF|nr:oxidoreductase NADbinding domain containing protein [Acanthamoeba castellanii str. Neff]ELR25299.1 oxidoreductase NADbinding domain containing protein [Acanthamoeba castellanii str. Neff]
MEYAYEDRVHEGEREVQAKLGVLEAQVDMTRVMRPYMPHQHRLFFQECLACLFVGSVDRQGQLWASVLPGLPGFIESPTDKSLHVRTPVPPHDPLVAGGGLQPGAPIGFLGMQLDTRRRNRANGKVARVHDGGRGGFDFALDISFGNCPKYIQTRAVEFTEDAGERLGRECEVVETKRVLSPEMRAYVERSDTFFVASCFLKDPNHPAHGVDVSHRGVEPGAIHFRDDGDGASAATTLVWPDYVGNFLFNTLGNLVKDPRCGLLFIDFGPSGDVLQLTGRATVEWDVREVPGAHRSVAFTVQRARLRETHDTMTLVLTATIPLTTTQKPGQYGTFLIDLPGGDASSSSETATLSRTWTLSSAPLSPSEYQVAITVKRQPGGKASAWLHDASVGDSLRLVNVGGDFHLPPTAPGDDAAAGAQRLLFVAGGVGVTPLMSMLRGLVHRQPAAVDVVFLYSVRTTDDFIFGDELVELASTLPGLALHVTALPRRGGVSVRRGRWTAEAIRECVPDLAERAAYVCGPDAFMTHITTLLKDELHSPAPVHTESFTY